MTVLTLRNISYVRPLDDVNAAASRLMCLFFTWNPISQGALHAADENVFPTVAGREQGLSSCSAIVCNIGDSNRLGVLIGLMGVDRDQLSSL